MTDEQNSNQAEFERQSALLRATLDSTADGILAVDVSGKVLEYNKKFVEMWGIPEEVLVTKDRPWISSIAELKGYSPP